MMCDMYMARRAGHDPEPSGFCPRTPHVYRTLRPVYCIDLYPALCQRLTILRV